MYTSSFPLKCPQIRHKVLTMNVVGLNITNPFLTLKQFYFICSCNSSSKTHTNTHTLTHAILYTFLTKEQIILYQ